MCHYSAGYVVLLGTSVASALTLSMTWVLPTVGGKLGTFAKVEDLYVVLQNCRGSLQFRQVLLQCHLFQGICDAVSDERDLGRL